MRIMDWSSDVCSADLRVGVLDADVYGPSIPTMLGLSGRPDSPDGKSIEPMRAHGIEAMSIGLLVEQDTPMIWRGPMATSALTQLLGETRWGGERSEEHTSELQSLMRISYAVS